MSRTVSVAINVKQPVEPSACKSQGRRGLILGRKQSRCRTWSQNCPKATTRRGTRASKPQASTSRLTRVNREPEEAPAPRVGRVHGPSAHERTNEGELWKTSVQSTHLCFLFQRYSVWTELLRCAVITSCIPGTPTAATPRLRGRANSPG